MPDYWMHNNQESLTKQELMHDDEFFHPTKTHSNTDATCGVSAASYHQGMGDVSMSNHQEGLI